MHDKATRGESLSAAEWERLNAWYAAQDAAEGALLSQPTPSSAVTTLRDQVAGATALLEVAAQHVHELTVRNAALREETAALQHQQAGRATSRIA